MESLKQEDQIKLIKLRGRECRATLKYVGQKTESEPDSEPEPDAGEAA